MNTEPRHRVPLQAVKCLADAIKLDEWQSHLTAQDQQDYDRAASEYRNRSLVK